ncbi:FecR family protein [Odoribacter sp. Z80]|uniref:FecR family protein n=1 Tax=Odoribacter sp. Z80 TaxID=2304575 RepID=UPI00137B541D|nr:FecR family protein [Odoribacter sp. Z80]NCE73141.1 DUF4974 domain-containing protein [Odoribacter sp. Z80]
MDIENQQYISRLILLFLQGKLSDGQTRELEEWRRANPEHEEMFRRMVSMERFSRQVQCYVKNREEQEKEWELIRRRTLFKEKWVWRYWQRYAAVLWVALAAGTLWYVVRNNGTESERDVVSEDSRVVLVLADGMEVELEDKEAVAVIDGLKEGGTAERRELNYYTGGNHKLQGSHTLKVPRGGEYALVLSDGSQVSLNAGSHIRYPVAFQGDTREVYVEGEAYFKIKRDTARPFIVWVNKMRVEVLGTEFAVRAYPEEKEVLTTLIGGHVRVAAGGRQVDLSPREQAVWRKGSDEMSVGEVNTDLFVGWKNGRLIFDNTPLSKILHELGRWYDFDVEYEDPELKSLPFSLDMEKYADFRQVLSLLEQTGRVRFSVSDNHIIVNN